MRAMESLTEYGRGRALLVAVLALIVVLLAAVVVTACSGPEERTPAPAGSPSDGSDGVARELLPNNPDFLGDGPLRLVRGENERDGVRVGYPQSVTGAVSAAIEYGTEITSTLDLDRVPAVLRAVSDGSYGSSDADLQAAPTFWRQKLGLPTTGPVPAGASLELVVSAYQVKDREPERITVLILGYVTGTTAEAGPQSFLLVFPVLLVWTGDWKLQKRSEDAPDYAELRARPGTPEAVAAGWQEYAR